MRLIDDPTGPEQPLIRRGGWMLGDAFGGPEGHVRSSVASSPAARPGRH